MYITTHRHWASYRLYVGLLHQHFSSLFIRDEWKDVVQHTDREADQYSCLYSGKNCLESTVAIAAVHDVISSMSIANTSRDIETSE